MSLWSPAVQLFQERTEGNRASGDLTDDRKKAKRISGSRLAGGNASRNGGGPLRILRKRGHEEHLSMEGASERESHVL
jgi:hypothetical protein